MFTLLIVGCAVLGLAIGSFLNVVIYRVPLHQSIASPPSACPNCTAPITPLDNIPVFSWLLLRGRCRTCAAPISLRYPIVELVTAALFAGAAARLGANWALPAFLVVFAGLFALAWIDVEQLLLPRVIVYPVLVLESAGLLLAAAVTGSWGRLIVALISAAAWFALFFILNAVNPLWLGFGDVRLSLVLGLALGWLGVRYVLLGFFGANLIGAVVGLTLIVTKRMSRDQQIPYGVFLALGTALAFFAGPVLLIPFRGIA